MTHLRKMMLEELQRRNYAETTISSYIRIVEDFSRRFQRPPDRLGPQHIREYQSELFRKRKLAASTVTVYLAALRFFYAKTLKKSWSAAETPYPKRAEHIPSILSQQEVTRLIDASDNSFHRTLLMTLYATGVRRAELTHLKISDVDSRKAGLFDVQFVAEIGDLFRFAFEVLIPLVGEDEIKTEKPSPDRFQPMPAAVAQVLMAKLGVELARIQMIDAPVTPVFAHRGVPLGHELLRQRMSPIAALGIDKGQELAGREVPGMHGHDIEETCLGYRVAKRREGFDLALRHLHKERISAVSSRSLKSRRACDASSP